MNADGRMTSWNEGGERLTGYRAEEVIGKPFGVLFTDEDQRAGKPVPELATARARGSASDHNWVVRKDGSRLWASGYTATLRDESGELRGFGKICRDLTERKKLEEVLRQRAGESAEADRRKDEFLAMLSHELRNPLAPICNAVHVLHQRGDDPAVVHWAKEVVERQVRHLTRLVDDLLDVSRITRGTVNLRRPPGAYRVGD